MRNESSVLKTCLTLLFSAFFFTVQALAFDTGLSIGLNFGADEVSGTSSGTLPSSTSAGVFPQRNWNNFSGNAGSSTTVVADQAGTSVPTTVSVTWTCPNTWSSTGRGEENDAFPPG